MKRRIKRLALLIPIVCILLHGTFQAMAGTEGSCNSFADAWQRVTAKNDTLAAARAYVEQAGQKRQAAKDMYLPQIGISAGYMYLDDKVTLSPNDILESMPAGNRFAPLLEGLGQTYGLSASALNSALTSTIAERQNRSAAFHGYWPIYAGGRIDAAQDIARGQETEAQQKLEVTRQEQFETLARYYFGALLAKQVLDAKNQVEHDLKRHRDNAVLLEKQGQIARVERLQAEAAYDKATVEQRKAGHDLQIARLALTRMLKSPETFIPTDTLFINTALPPLSSFIDKTLTNAPALGMLKSKQQQAAGLVSVEEGKYLPTVAVFGNYNLYEENSLANKLVPDWVVGIGIQIPLLERSGRSGNLGAAKSAVKQLESLQLQAKSDISVLTEKTYRQAEQALEEYQGLRSSMTLGRETVNLRVKAFGQGLSTSLDVVDAEMFLVGVTTQRSAATYTYVVALARLLALSGQPEDFFTYQHIQETEVR